MFKTNSFPRSKKIIDTQIKNLIEMGWDFVLQHGTYTTKIIKPQGKIVFSTIKFRNKVFVASAMVKRDALKTELGQEIMKNKHLKTNYANSDSLKSYKADKVLNIDIKGAYASCLYLHDLITYETFEYLCALKKDERLPAVGLLAKSHIKYHYSQGKCIKVEPYRAETAEIFFFLIQQIDCVMRDVKWILGDDFIYYWVDGVFFKETTPHKKIQAVMDYLASLGYNYTYEMCDNFSFSKKNGQCKISLLKGDTRKEWNFKDSNAEDGMIKNYLYAQSQKYTDSLHD